MNRQQGFSLAEVTVTLGILALIAGISLGAPRHEGLSQALIAHDFSAALRHARSRAVATRCPVQFSATGSGFALAEQSRCGEAGYTAADAFDAPLAPPDLLGSDYRDSIRNDTALLPTTTFYFDALGRATDAGGVAVDLSLAVGRTTILVEGETGLIAHEAGT